MFRCGKTAFSPFCIPPVPPLCLCLCLCLFSLFLCFALCLCLSLSLSLSLSIYIHVYLSLSLKHTHTHTRYRSPSVSHFRIPAVPIDVNNSWYYLTLLHNLKKIYKIIIKYQCERKLQKFKWRIDNCAQKYWYFMLRCRDSNDKLKLNRFYTRTALAYCIDNRLNLCDFFLFCSCVIPNILDHKPMQQQKTPRKERQYCKRVIMYVL